MRITPDFREYRKALDRFISEASSAYALGLGSKASNYPINASDYRNGADLRASEACTLTPERLALLLAEHMHLTVASVGAAYITLRKPVDVGPTAYDLELYVYDRQGEPNGWPVVALRLNKYEPQT